MRDLIQLADAFADSGEPVLITGETGTGKELFARRLHERSRRSGRELVAVNVSAPSPSRCSGASSSATCGARSAAPTAIGQGLAARADGGTLFLDEIGDLPLEVQPRLLRLLQDGTYQALGDPAQRHTRPAADRRDERRPAARWSRPAASGPICSTGCGCSN